MSITRLLLIGTSLTMLAGCAQINALVSTQTTAPIAQSVAINAENRWWHVFNDPLMEQFADDLVKQNLDMKIAALRVSEARGLSRSANAALYPELSATGNASRGNKQIGFDKPVSIAQGGFDASWEIDLFGRASAGVEASQKRVAAQVASAEDVTNSVLAELIRAVINLREAQRTFAQTKELLEIQENQVALFAARTTAGLIDSGLLTRAQAEYAQTATLLPLARAAQDSAQFNIERLLGKESGALDAMISATPAPLTVPPAAATLEVSLTTLQNRPDVRAAQLEFLATNADLARAEADLWPHISISSFFGVQDGSKGLRIAENPVWSLASGITAPILNFGKLRGAIDAADAHAKAASLTYENASLIALQEAKTALSDYLNGINAVTEQERALKLRADSVHLAAERFKQGLTDMTALTTAQAELNAATMALTKQQAATAIAYIRLQKALGTSVRKAH